MSTWSRIANVFRSGEVNRDIDEELQSHLEEAVAEGRDPAETARAFGSKLRARERVRDAVVATWLDSMLADVVFGWRQLLKHKTASAAAVVSLALAIGSCLAAFHLIDALFLRPLPVTNPERLYVLAYEGLDQTGGARVDDSFDYPGFRRLRSTVKNDAELISISYGVGRHDITFGSDLEMEKVHWQFVSGWMFSELGLKPQLGRLFTKDDDVTPGAHPYAVISFDYWMRSFGKDPGVIGRTFRNGNDLYQIIGVAPRGFAGTETGTVTDVFVPSMMNTADIERSTANWFRIWVSLKPAASPDQVRSKLAAAVRMDREEKLKQFPGALPKHEIDRFVGARVLLEPAAAGASGMQRNYRRALAILAVLVALVLLIACVNVANLMTAQAAARVREMALRVSIGAGRGRLIQLVLAESALIAVCASVLGILLAWWAAPFVVGMINPPDDPARLILLPDMRVTLFAVALTFGVTILFGLAPGLRASSVKPGRALKGAGDSRSHRIMHAMIAAQVSFCFLVLLVAGMFIASFEKLAHEPIGFSSARLLTLETVSKQNQPAEVWYQTVARLRDLPGVESAAVAGWALMSGNGWDAGVWTNGHTPEDTMEPWFLNVSPGWLETMKIALLDGRDFHADESFPTVAIVNQTFAQRFFDGRNPLGQKFEMQLDPNKRYTIKIVGYARDARYLDMREAIPPTVYVPFSRTAEGPLGSNGATFLVRTRAPDSLSMAAVLRREVPRAQPEFRVSNIRTQDELVRAQTLRERMLAMLSLFFAIVALMLAGVGLYGVLDYVVLQRRRELGIRIALGAKPGHIVSKVTTEIFAMLLTGGAAGLALGIFLERYVTTLLYQVKVTDTSTLAVPVIALFGIAVLAMGPPVLRALRIDPAEMLRSE